MSRCRFRLADMMPNAWFHKFKHMSSRRRKPDPSPISDKGPACPSPHLHHSSRPRLTTHILDQPRASYGGRKVRRRAVYRSSTSLGGRVGSSSNWGYHSSPAPGLIPPVNGTEVSTDKAHLIPAEMDSGRESVEIEFMDAGGGLSSSASSSNFNSFWDNFSSHPINELDDSLSPTTLSAPDVPRLIPCPKLAPEVKISDKEHCKVKHMLGWTSSHGNYGLKLRQNSPVIGRRRKSRACSRKSFSSTLPLASNVMVRFANKNLGESLAMVKSSYNPKRDFSKSMVEMVMASRVQTLKDLEDLLAGYLSLNSTRHHQDIVKAFEQIRVKMSALML